MDTEDLDVVSALKTIKQKDVTYMIAKLLIKIPRTTIINSWGKAWPDIEKLVNNDD